MVILLDDSLFSGQVPAIPLFGLIHLLSSNRHLFEVDDTQGTYFDTWWTRLDGRSQQDVSGVLTASRAQLAQPLRRSSVIRVVAQNNDEWDISTPRLSLASALAYLHLSFSIFLENNRSDRSFIEAFMTPEERREFQHAVHSGWIDVKNGGGLAEMRQQILDECNSRPAGVSLRTYALFDSEAMYPGEPIPDSERAMQTCENYAIQFLQLRRRAIENYLPEPALSMWCHASVRRAERLGPTFRAFQRMNRQQKAHFNMKAGLRGDAPNVAKAKDLFGTLDIIQRRDLQRGFGSRLSNSYLDANVTNETTLGESGAWAEVRPAVQRLLLML